jgi:hypothetical protein
MDTLRLCVAVVAAFVVPVVAQAKGSSKDDLCGRLRAFEAAPFEVGSDGQPIRRFVEFQWSDSWLTGGTWGCRHTPDAVARSFCSYLIDNTNQEFSVALPWRVLKCHGYVFPSYSTDWNNWTADIVLRGSRDDRSLDLDVYLIHGSVDAAVRISAIPLRPSRDDREPPSLKSTPPVSGKDP